MKIYNNILDFNSDNPISIIIGTFDGVHKGHQKIFNEFIKLSKKENLQSTLITFDPHPRKIISKDDFKLITTLTEKISIIKKYNIDNIIIQNFNLEFSKISYMSFFENLLLKSLNVKLLVLGYDNHFGRNREGNFESIKKIEKKHDFKLIRLEALKENDVNISSSKIRNLIIDGDIYNANKFLGYTFFISGTVINGNKIGSKIGFPTANIFIGNDDKLIPKNGVYAVDISVKGKIYNGISNIGFKPTLNEKNTNISLEVHIFDFKENIYEETVTVFFTKRIRNEKKFNNIEDLKSQIYTDIINANNLLKSRVID